MGAIVAAWITFGTFRIKSTWAWRIPSIFQALPSLLQGAFIFLLPESPRWLVSKGREAAALDVLAKYHGNGDRDDEVVQFEYAEIVGTIEMEIAAKGTQWRELVRGRQNQWRLFIMVWFGICKQWSGNGVVSYYLHTVSLFILPTLSFNFQVSLFALHLRNLSQNPLNCQRLPSSFRAFILMFPKS